MAKGCQQQYVDQRLSSESDTYQNGTSSPGSSTQSRYTEEFVLELQQELVKARLREAEATVQLNEAHDRINQLEFDYRFFDLSLILARF